MDADKQAQAKFYMEQAAILFASADNSEAFFFLSDRPVEVESLPVRWMTLWGGRQQVS